jgi:hypothetical protein
MPHKHRHQNPHRATTGRPEIWACAVNSIDENGKADGSLARAGHGQLVAIFDGIPKPVDEKRFARTLRFWWEGAAKSEG